VTFAPENTLNWSSNALVQTDSLPLASTITNTYFLNGKILSAASPAATVKPKKLSPSTGFLFVLKPLLHALGADDNTLIDSIISVNAIINSGATSILDPKIFTKADNNAQRVRFTGATLPAALNVVGTPQCHLIVSASHSNAYYYVQILEHPSKGKIQLVTRGAFKDHSSTPSTPHAIDFPIFSVNHTFQAGSQIFFQITSRDYPFFLPNLNQPIAKIYDDATHSSTISLPVVP
jgi:predicted acyl esterase